MKYFEKRGVDCILFYLVFKALFFIFHFLFTNILLYLYFDLFSEERALRKAEMEATKVFASYLVLACLE